MRKSVLFGVVCVLALVCAQALASPGGTDANGGHYNHTTGLYHYHHGYPEHQHENGICPYTGETWILKIPEKPATLAEWEAQKNRTEKEIEEEFPLDPDVIFVNTKEEEPASGIPAGAVAASVGAVGAAGAALVLRRRKQKQIGHKEERHQLEQAEMPSALPAQDPEEMPADTCIGEDGLPWEREAYKRYQEKRKADPMDNAAYTRFSEPKWGARYSFCTGATGDTLHTLACEDAFLQINAADPKVPSQMCPKCRPELPDLRFMKRVKAVQGQKDKEQKESA